MLTEKLVINGDISSNPADIKDHLLIFPLSSTARMSIGVWIWMVSSFNLLLRR
jgi:hypothetical protein